MGCWWPGQEKEVPVSQGASIGQQSGHKPLLKLRDSDTSGKNMEGILDSGRAAGTEGGSLHSKAGQAATKREDVVKQLEGHISLLSYQPGGPKTGPDISPREVRPLEGDFRRRRRIHEGGN